MTAPTILNPTDVKNLVLAGKLVIIFKDKVYDITKWKDSHPGGILALEHMNGQDATDAMIALHPEVVFEKLKYFFLGDFECDIEDVQFKRNSKVSKEYRKLNEKILELGFYETNIWFWIRENVKFAFLYVIAICLVVFQDTDLGYLTSSLLLGFLWHQVAFVAHDSGHNGITANRKADTIYGMFLADFIGGLSIGWWKLSHYVHHIITNDPEHDPDIQHMPFFAITSKFFKEKLYSTFHSKYMEPDFLSKLFVPNQHNMYYVILAFGRFNLYVQSWMHVFYHPKVPYRQLEILFMAGYWLWFVKLLSLLPTWKHVFWFILVSHVVTMILHLQITLSHFGMSTEYPPYEEGWTEKQLRTSMDVECPRWMDWFHGGLQFQVEHHLYPRIPRHNLRSVQPLVKKLARENGFKFHSYTFTKGNYFVLGRLKEAADQVRAILNANEKNIKSE